MVALDRLYSITAPCALRLGEMAALNTKSVVLVMWPDWITTSPGPDCFSSYQVAIDPAPPATVCCVQIPLTGSPTACVRRPSEVSMVLVEPACGADGGNVAKLGVVEYQAGGGVNSEMTPASRQVRWIGSLRPADFETLTAVGAVAGVAEQDHKEPPLRSLVPLDLGVAPRLNLAEKGA